MGGLLKSGLLSITFRKRSAGEIIELAADERLDSIEWGGDIHVPHGDLNIAHDVRKQTEDRGLIISAYGSYFRAGSTEPANPSPSAVLETALALDTQTIRIWAGASGSANTDEAQRAVVIQSIADLCDRAWPHGLIIATEFHGRTLTDDIRSTMRLLSEVNRPNLRTFWQPPVAMASADALSELKSVRPSLSNVHVFHWWPDAKTRRPLAEGTERWRDYLREVNSQCEHDGVLRFASMEFVRDDDVQQFREDANTLHELIAGATGSRSR